jgi:hypothetical protein
MAIKYLYLGDYEIRKVAIEIQFGQGGQDWCCGGKNCMNLVVTYTKTLNISKFE